MTDTPLTLYTRPDCHLCDEAQALLSQAGLIEQVQIVDIEPDLKLIARYGDKIPVLHHADGQEWCWPFTLQQLSSITRQ
ncbi:MAG: glutaredoxin family protein [Wenzhouxiangellaceae bacterium]